MALLRRLQHLFYSLALALVRSPASAAALASRPASSVREESPSTASSAPSSLPGDYSPEDHPPPRYPLGHAPSRAVVTLSQSGNEWVIEDWVVVSTSPPEPRRVRRSRPEVLPPYSTHEDESGPTPARMFPRLASRRPLRQHPRTTPVRHAVLPGEMAFEAPDFGIAFAPPPVVELWACGDARCVCHATDGGLGS